MFGDYSIGDLGSIFVMPSSAGPIKHITGDIQMPISPDK